MPICDGYKATEQIREYLSEKNLQQPVIVACTGNVEQSQIDHAFKSLFDEVISKPATNEVMRAVLNEVIWMEVE